MVFGGETARRVHSDLIQHAAEIVDTTGLLMRAANILHDHLYNGIGRPPEHKP